MRYLVKTVLSVFFVLLASAGGCDCGRLFGPEPSAGSEPARQPGTGKASRLAATGGDVRWTFLRLGPAELPVASTVFEVRSVLPEEAEQSLEVDLHPGCLLELGATTRDDRAKATFRVSFLDPRGTVVQRFEKRIERSVFWHDFAIPSETDEPVTSLRLGIEETIGDKALWSRPYALCPASGGEERRRNVILISLDTLRADRLGVYGNPDGLTPNLDRMAGEGTVFANAYATYPNTLLSHGSLFTGLFPRAERSERDMDQPRLRAGIETLAGRFAAAGYATGAITENGFVGSGFGFKRGFDVYDDGDNKEDYPGYAAMTFQKALKWLERRRRVPFFLFVHTYEVHAPYSVSPDLVEKIAERFPGYTGRRYQRFAARDCARYNTRQLRLDEREVAWIERLYDEEARRLDAVVGAFRSGLERLGLSDTTLLVLFSDHGEEFSEHGYLGHGETLHRQALHVPLVFWAPGTIPGGRRVEQPISLIDVGPTLAELVGVGTIFTTTPARSRLDWISGKVAEPAAPVFSELAFRRASCPAGAEQLHACRYGGIAVRDDRYAYIQLSISNAEHLFDLDQDGEERTDLTRERPRLLERYRVLVEAYRARTEPSPLVETASRLDGETREKLRALGYIE